MKLTKAQTDEFEEEGFLVVRECLQDTDLDPVIEEYSEHIDRRAGQLQSEGKLTDVHAGAGFDRRLALISQECNEIYPELDIMHLRGKASFAFLRNDNLLDMVESFVGPEITCSPIQHIRAKMPGKLVPRGSDPHVAPWHQDAGVTWEEADDVFILTVWLPMSPARQENGCLQIIPRTHGSGVRQHVSRAGQGTVIADDEMPTDKPVTLPMDKGDVLFLHKQIPHRSTSNRSETVRWSMDLRYQKTGTLTGRPFHPDFVVRSRAHPDSVLTDWSEWDRMWAEAQQKAAVDKPRAHRWAAAPAK